MFITYRIPWHSSLCCYERCILVVRRKSQQIGIANLLQLAYEASLGHDDSLIYMEDAAISLAATGV